MTSTVVLQPVGCLAEMKAQRVMNKIPRGRKKKKKMKVIDLRKKTRTTTQMRTARTRNWE